MKITLSRTAFVAALGVGIVTALWASAEETRVTFPDLDALIHYTTVNRGDVTEHMLTTQAAINAARSGQPIPAGTQVVLVDNREDEVYRYFVMEKGADWGADYDEGRRTGDWQFQFYWGDRSINMEEEPPAAKAATSHGPSRNTCIPTMTCAGLSNDTQP